ncbi:multidrug resistance-associated ABC transporter [Flammula alnicola]|nr:multidrug resistance-associated ABC transporter [Flammula alnicola]
MDVTSWGSRLLTMARSQARDNLIVNDSLFIPFAIAVVLIIGQTLHALVACFRYLRKGSSLNIAPIDEEDAPTRSVTSLQLIQARANDHGGWTIFVYAVARLAGCLTLLVLSSTTIVHCRDWRENSASPLRLFFACPESFMVLTYLYSSILAITSLAITKWSTLATRHNVLILLSTFMVYIYRDIWPVATYTEVPKDGSQGYLLWIKITILSITAVVIPFFVPRRYVPVDPKDPMPVPNDEQTCSLFSFLLYSYLDPVIFLGYRVEHLEVNQLPPLSDTDYSKNLIKRAFPYLDPFKRSKPRHLFFGLIRVFRKDYSLMALAIVGQVVIGFLSPIAIYHILNYLETGGVGDNIRPWFWIICLFMGPLANGGFFQYYIFVATRMLTHAEALLTELVFEHSLRIRFATESPTATTNREEQDNTTVVGTPDTSSVVENSSEEAENVDNSPAASSDSQSTTTDASTKGKAKDDSPPPNPAPAAIAVAPVKETKNEANLVGKINNLVTTDLGNIVDARDFLLLILSVPLQICLCTAFLYQMLGWSAFVGLACMIALMPAPGYAAKLIQDVQRKRMKMTDARIQTVTEVVNVLRMVKLFGWEGRMSERIQDTRNAELLSIWKLKVLQSLTGVVNSIIPTISMLVTYATYTVIMKQELTPSVIFSSLTVFGTLRMQLFRISWQITANTQGKVSLDRVNDFLKKTELLDSFTNTEVEVLIPGPPSFSKNAIGFKNASFSWSVEAGDGSLTPSRRSFRLRVDDELFFKPNCINLIIGPTGSGKTSMLMALLGEMHFMHSGADSWFNLPRDGGVAYAAQESWVQNETIRANILFGSPYDEVRYRQVLRQCALDKDFELFEAGDNTEVGEKGITLSGGQKARVTLARAIYSQAKIILLDDVLAALDVHTSAWIVEKCFGGDLVKGRTVLLVTHNVALVSPVAKFVVSIGHDGVIKTQGMDIETSLASDPTLVAEVQLEQEEMEIANQEIPSLAKKEAPADGKLVLAEEIAKGHVTWKSLKLFLSGLGGDYPLIFFSLWISGFLIANSVRAFQVWFLGYWGSQYETHHPSEVRVFHYLSLYSLIVIGAIVLSNASFFLYVSGSMKASRTINTLLVESVLGSTLRWLDETPTARIISRFTQDIRMVDGPIAEGFLSLSSIGVTMITNIGVILIFTPIFLFPGLAVAALGLYLGNIYLKAQLSAKREMSNARSPVLAHFSAAVAGIVSIRAYGAQAAFKVESLKRIDNYVRIARVCYNLNRWISLRINILGDLFNVALASYLVYGPSIGASNTGFSLNMAADFCTMILWWVRIFNEFEVQANSLERIQGYIDIDHEPKPTKSGEPPAAWPTSGDLVVEKLSARYSQTGPTVLHDLSFHIESGQRVGVVGRTGSGKSSLTLSLLRCIVTEGTVYYDGIPTSKINLHSLRSNITIIPQTPELLSGTLRRNLDPFEEHDDATLNDALRAAGLFSLQDELGEARITLDSNITTGGGNLSVGEKQILALARAMVRGSKLLILDEATSAIDYKTDAVIQTTLRHKLNVDVTVITIAHRLQTIMDADRIMVLDEGRIAEFDTPKSLLQRDDSMFKALVDGSGDKAALYEMAEGKASSSRHEEAPSA